ncbi:unnamed protein product [Paramecium primaurelia]|uniref:Uncharacterized protein n=1 Tax=Paramecium primaurelia TaxID=5886 RepID=A0A8S1KCI7_PARPR|nr:unnamed protein product [Paramecium primaurelia]
MIKQQKQILILNYITIIFWQKNFWKNYLGAKFKYRVMILILQIKRNYRYIQQRFQSLNNCNNFNKLKNYFLINNYNKKTFIKFIVMNMIKKFFGYKLMNQKYLTLRDNKLKHL